MEELSAFSAGGSAVECFLAAVFKYHLDSALSHGKCQFRRFPESFHAEGRKEESVNYQVQEGECFCPVFLCEIVQAVFRKF